MPRIVLDLAAPMNGASLMAGLDGSFKFRTHPSCGGHSGYFPLRREASEPSGAEFDVDVDVNVGTIGIAAVDSEMAIICERFSSRGGGAQTLHLRLPDLAKITGLLLRNADERGLPSEGISKTSCFVLALLPRLHCLSRPLKAYYPYRCGAAFPPLVGLRIFRLGAAIKSIWNL